MCRVTMCNRVHQYARVQCVTEYINDASQCQTHCQYVIMTKILAMSDTDARHVTMSDAM